VGGSRKWNSSNKNAGKLSPQKTQKTTGGGKARPRGGLQVGRARKGNFPRGVLIIAILPEERINEKVYLEEAFFVPSDKHPQSDQNALKKEIQSRRKHDILTEYEGKTHRK